MSNIQNNDEDLKEILAKSSHKITSKFTKVLGFVAIGVWLLAVGTWYGHHSASTNTTNGSSANFTSQRNSNSGGNGGNNFGGFGGSRVSGTVSKVAGSEITIKLDDPTQSKSFKSGDTARLIGTSNSSGDAQQIPNGSETKSSSPKSSAKPSARPSITSSNGNGQRGGLFSDPKVQACLKNEGIDLSSGQRPDRNDPNVIAALQKCIPNFGQGGPRPTATP